MKEKGCGLIKKEALQLLAVIFMLLDHIWATYMSVGDWMTYVGRMAFPIFAFLIAEGFSHTSDIKKYILRLTAFAVASEIPFNLFYSSRWFNPYHQNAIFTLLLGLLAITVIESLRKCKSIKEALRPALTLLLIALLSVVGFTDYGFLGVLTVVMFSKVRLYPLLFLKKTSRYLYRPLPYFLCYLYGFITEERVRAVR